MTEQHSTERRRIPVVCVATIVVASILIVGLRVRDTSSALAETPEPTHRGAFLSGGARSEVVLREIKTILERMDARIARIEKTAAVMQRKAEGRVRVRD
jgi:hypothetical protein